VSVSVLDRTISKLRICLHPPSDTAQDKRST
jgi:hypothetical protein